MSFKPFAMYKSEEEIDDMCKSIETKRDKKLVIMPHGRYGLFIIKWEDGRGVLPDDLKGSFTTHNKAEKAITTYLHKQRPNRAYKERLLDEQREQEERELDDGSLSDDQEKESEDEQLPSLFGRETAKEDPQEIQESE